MNKKSIPIQTPPDWDNTQLIAEGMWVLLSGSDNLMDAVIKRDMFIAEVKAIIWAAYHAGQFKERERIQIITPIELAERLFSIHSHAEIEYEVNPDQVVYKEKDIIALLENLGQPKPDWEGYAEQFQEFSQEEFAKKLKDKAKGRRHRDRIAEKHELLSSPGDTIMETIDSMGMPLKRFCERMDMDLGSIVKLFTGDEAITEPIAEKLQEVLEIDKQFWLNREKLYRAKLAELNKTKP